MPKYWNCTSGNTVEYYFCCKMWKQQQGEILP